MQCKFEKKDTTRCNANSMRESDYCFTHNPDSELILVGNHHFLHLMLEGVAD